jgi:hypothetical protein
VLLLTIASAAAAQTPPAPSPSPAQQPLEPDRPDVTNGAHLVHAGEVQVELGGILTRVTVREHSFGSPITVRVGVATWIEARIATDGLLSLADDHSRTTGFGNVQLGAKLRLWADSDGEARLSILPAVNLPTADAEKGLGSGDADYSATLLTGVDLGKRGHIDFNYGLNAIGAGGGRSHFTQHLASASANLTIDKWSPYVELYTFSKMAPNGGAVTAADTGAIYTLNPRMAVDAGLQFGISHAAPDFAAFAGFSFSVGHPRGGGSRAVVTSACPPGRDRD